MEMKINEILEKSDDLVNESVSLSGFTSESTIGPKVHISGKKWFNLKDDSGQILCLASEKAVGKGLIKAQVIREAGIVYLEA